MCCDRYMWQHAVAPLQPSYTLSKFGQRSSQCADAQSYSAQNSEFSHRVGCENIPVLAHRRRKFQQAVTGVPVLIKHVFTGVPKFPQTFYRVYTEPPSLKRCNDSIVRSQDPNISNLIASVSGYSRVHLHFVSRCVYALCVLLLEYSRIYLHYVLHFVYTLCILLYSQNIVEYIYAMYYTLYIHFVFYYIVEYT